MTNKRQPTDAFVKAWLTSRTCAAVILIIFRLSRHFAIQHLFLSSTFNISIKHLYQADQSLLPCLHKCFNFACYADRQTMIIKIARKEAIDKYSNLPSREWISEEEGYDDSCFPQTFASYVLTLPSKSYRGHIKALGKELTTLTKNFGFDNLIFLGDIDIAWLKRDHDFKPVKEALQYLIDNKIGKRFNGALQVDITQLSSFIVHLAWLVRTNTILPYVYCIDPDQNFIASICQYGNLHFSTLKEISDKVFRTEILKTNLQFMKELNCYNKFAKTNAIKGRQTTL